MHQIEQKAGRRETMLIVHIEETHMDPRGVEPIMGAVQDVGNSTIFSGYAKVRAVRCQRMTEDA